MSSSKTVCLPVKLDIFRWKFCLYRLSSATHGYTGIFLAALLALPFFIDHPIFVFVSYRSRIHFRTDIIVMGKEKQSTVLLDFKGIVVDSRIFSHTCPL